MIETDGIENDFGAVDIMYCYSQHGAIQDIAFYKVKVGVVIGLACLPFRILAKLVAKGTETTRIRTLRAASFSVIVHFVPPAWLKGNTIKAQTPPISTKQSLSPLVCPCKTSFGISC